MKRNVAAALSTVLALGAIGCGGSSSDPGEAARHDFRSQANAMCQEISEKVQKALTTAISDINAHHVSRTQGLAKLGTTVVTLQRTGMKQLATLDVPAARQAQFKHYLAARHQKNALEPTLGSQAPSKNESQRRLAGEQKAKLAKAIGIDKC